MVNLKKRVSKRARERHERQKRLLRLAEILWLSFRALNVKAFLTASEILAQRGMAGRVPGTRLVVTCDSINSILREGAKKGLVCCRRRRNREEWEKDRFRLTEK